jgi:hypothetical protein
MMDYCENYEENDEEINQNESVDVSSRNDQISHQSNQPGILIMVWAIHSWY